MWRWTGGWIIIDMNKEVQEDARYIWGKVNDVKFTVSVVKVKWNGGQ